MLRSAEEAARLRARSDLWVHLVRVKNDPLTDTEARHLLHLARIAFGAAPPPQAKGE